MPDTQTTTNVVNLFAKKTDAKWTTRQKITALALYETSLHSFSVGASKADCLALAAHWRDMAVAEPAMYERYMRRAAEAEYQAKDPTRVAFHPSAQQN